MQITILCTAADGETVSSPPVSTMENAVILASLAAQLGATNRHLVFEGDAATTRVCLD